MTFTQWLFILHKHITNLQQTNKKGIGVLWEQPLFHVSLSTLPGHRSCLVALETSTWLFWATVVRERGREESSVVKVSHTTTLWSSWQNACKSRERKNKLFSCKQHNSSISMFLPELLKVLESIRKIKYSFYLSPNVQRHSKELWLAPLFITRFAYMLILAALCTINALICALITCFWNVSHSFLPWRSLNQTIMHAPRSGAPRFLFMFAEETVRPN